MDLYGYCTDDPVNFMDRSGLAGSSEAGEDGKDEDKQEDPKEKHDETKGDIADSAIKNNKKSLSKNKGYMAGIGLSGALPGFEVGGSLDFAYINEDEAAIIVNGDIKGSSSLGATLDFFAGTHNASKVEDFEGASTTASFGVAIPGTPVSGGYSKEMSKASTIDKAYLSVGNKVNPALIPEVSGGRSASKVLVKFNPPIDEIVESGKSVGKAVIGTIDNNLEKQAKSRKMTPKIPPRTSIR